MAVKQMELAYYKKEVERLGNVFADVGIKSFDDFFDSLDLLTGWFEGYFMKPSAGLSMQPTAKNLNGLARIMRAIDKHYPRKAPAYAYRLTRTKAKPTDAELLGMKKIKQPRKILSFAEDIAAARTVFGRLYRGDVNDSKTFGDKSTYHRACYVIMKVKVTPQTFLVTHKQCVEFLEACVANWDYFIAAFGGARTSNQIKKLGITDKPWRYTPGVLKVLVKDATRPMIRNQKEIVMIFTSKTLVAEVIEVMFNGGAKE